MSEEKSLHPIPWPSGLDLLALRSYGVRQVLVEFQLSWDGGTTKYVRVLGSYFGADEGVVMARLGREGFSSALGSLKNTVEEILVDRFSGETEGNWAEGNWDGVIVVDVDAGTYLIGEGEL